MNSNQRPATQSLRDWLTDNIETLLDANTISYIERNVKVDGTYYDIIITTTNNEGTRAKLHELDKFYGETMATDIPDRNGVDKLYIIDIYN
jgi:hypothetical protein